jgi:hypothetical protein
MHKMRVINYKNESVGGYEFLAFGLASERMDGMMSIYNVVICKNREGQLEEWPV